MKTTKNKDHYVPQLYLRRFLAPKKNTLIAYHKEKDGYCEPQPDAICALKGWDNLDDKDTVPPFLKNILQKIEPKLDEVLNKLQQRPLSRSDRFILSYWLAIIMLLSPNSLNNFEEFLGMLAGSILEFMSREPLAYFSEKDVAIFNKYKDSLKITVNKFYAKNLAMSAVYDTALAIYACDWYILENKTDFLYLTSDRPFHFICWNDSPNNMYNPKGIALDPRHYLKIEPINPELHEKLRHNKGIDYTKISSGFTKFRTFDIANRHNINAIKFINQHTIYNADRFIIAGARNKNLDSFIRHNKLFNTKTVFEEIELGDHSWLNLTRLKNNFPNFEIKRKKLTSEL